jgi:hypothetical protein
MLCASRTELSQDFHAELSRVFHVAATEGSGLRLPDAQFERSKPKVALVRQLDGVVAAAGCAPLVGRGLPAS